MYKPRAYCNVAAIILVTVTSPYRYRVQYIIKDLQVELYKTHIAAFNEYKQVLHIGYKWHAVFDRVRSGLV